ncbi:6,7-dimethyl-8-ribityllumazine synthase [Pelagicoccus sp. NFK12]|uniref:6,7-dimethyl-8-ribityllumazine synthase n=1 Tax=Pelagicoccus enzymogenes TaxID=2773457 RepID=A0A927IFM4_9BACT|nr:6,7-dimethyl-8-ribityllumazine synthase [Pelagicoccus enzymogenes]MBD5778261.1 6,7-dimethyl-8-ribityllumazine synthase [Pelagicoccus enzymogenes]MDQ8200929.1 6,7-dimethyl-8-ribityllumazine synthase [Pelagicoccus enzymogenes]
MSQLSPSALKIDGSDFRIGVVAARFNEEYVAGLLDGALAALKQAGVADDAIVVERVPGANELPVAAKFLVDTGKFDAVIALGVVIAGGTRHYEMVSDSANHGLQQVAVTSGLPVVAGLIVGENEEQVRERCIGSIPKGSEFGQCALEMAKLRRNYL